MECFIIRLQIDGHGQKIKQLIMHYVQQKTS